jgi:hypothetical protein
MRKYFNYTTCCIAFLLLVFCAGCGDSDNASLVPPTVLSQIPASGSGGVCPNTLVNVTFSAPMNPATINSTTFTLTTGTPPVSVDGVVTNSASTNTATFTPSASLALNTLYTATITTGALSAQGIALASDFVFTFTTGNTVCLGGPPNVISTTPANGVSSVCPDTVVLATFSEAMNPVTINSTTFTLTSGTPPVAVAGTVTYDIQSYVAIFTPTNPLTLNTLYTATITTGVQDLNGISLAGDYVWTFTTSLVPCASGVPIGSACPFGILAATPVVSSNGPTVVTGDIGIWPASSITGFPPGTLTGTEYAGDAVAQTAQGDLTVAYDYAAGAAGGTVLSADIGSQTLVPGVYKTTSAQPSLGITGTLTLSGNGVYIFQIVSSLTTAANNSDVVLIGGATSDNVFWQVGSSATLGTSTTFAGTIMAQASVSLDTGATLNGRALARTGSISLLSNPVNVPPCP